jgi:lipopolysaccharide export system permease protein
MTLVDRYIFKTIAGAALIALLVLLMLEMFFSLLAEIDDLGVNGYALSQVFYYLLLRIPQRIYEIFPVALLLGGLLGMGSLANGSELVCMRAAGLSLLRLVGAALQAGLVLGLLAFAVGEFIAPKTERLADELHATARSENIAIRKGWGIWARDGERFMNILGILPGIGLKDIYIYELDEQFNLTSLSRANSARYTGGHWEMRDVVRSRLTPEEVSVDFLPSTVMASVISPGLLNVLASNPQGLSTRDLSSYIEYLENNGLDSRSYHLAFWVKVIAPLTNLTMVYIAMPFVFGHQRTASTGQRLLVGVFIGLLFYLANRLVGNAVLLYGYHPFLGAALPTFLFVIAGTVALRRMR